jgi:hypothetical protein
MTLLMLTLTVQPEFTSSFTFRACKPEKQAQSRGAAVLDEW